ncbi:MAG: hypothetical protein V3V03_02920 [Hyphomonadaceae bacterium]
MPRAADAGIEPLILDLVEWVGKQPRTYTDVMAVWRTSCPRLTVWEDTCDRGLVARTFKDGRPMIEISNEGQELLAVNGRSVRHATGE